MAARSLAGTAGGMEKSRRGLGGAGQLRESSSCAWRGTSEKWNQSVFLQSGSWGLGKAIRSATKSQHERRSKRGLSPQCRNKQGITCL